MSILLRNRSSSFSVGLPRSACPIVSIMSVFYDQYTLASHISYCRSTIKYIPVTKNTSKLEQLQQRRPERSLAHDDFVRLSFVKPIGKLQYRDIEKRWRPNYIFVNNIFLLTRCSSSNVLLRKSKPYKVKRKIIYLSTTYI